MVSLFPSPADVKAGVVDYVMNPTNVGYVTIAIVVLVVTFNLGWCVSLAPLAQSGNSPELRPRPRPTALTPPSPASIATSQVPPRNVLPPQEEGVHHGPHHPRAQRRDLRPEHPERRQAEAHHRPPAQVDHVPRRRARGLAQPRRSRDVAFPEPRHQQLRGVLRGAHPEQARRGRQREDEVQQVHPRPRPHRPRQRQGGDGGAQRGRSRHRG